MQIDFDIDQGELLTLLKLMKRTVSCDAIMGHFNEEECELLCFFVDELQNHALEYAI